MKLESIAHFKEDNIVKIYPLRALNWQGVKTMDTRKLSNKNSN